MDGQNLEKRNPTETNHALSKKNNKKKQFPVFWIEAPALKYISRETMSMYSCCRAKQRQSENAQPSTEGAFASGAAIIDKEGFGQVREWDVRKVRD